MLCDAAEDEYVRAAAARALGSVGGEAALDALLTVEVESAYVRDAVATSLGVLGDGRAVPRLVEWLDDEPTRSDAADALGRIGDPVAVPPLARWLESPHWWERSAARTALIELGHPDAVAALQRDRWLLRGMRVRAAERAVRRRMAPPPAVATWWPRRLRVSAVMQLGMAVAIAWLPTALLDSDPRAWRIASIATPPLFLAMLALDRRERGRVLDRARWKAARAPRVRQGGSPVSLIVSVLVARPWWFLSHAGAVLALEWATGGTGIVAGLIAALFAATGLERAVQARLVARWERRAGERLLAGSGGVYFAAPLGAIGQTAGERLGR